MFSVLAVAFCQKSSPNYKFDPSGNYTDLKFKCKRLDSLHSLH